MLAFETGRFTVPGSTMWNNVGAKSAQNAVRFVSAKDGQPLRDYLFKPAMRHNENPRAFFIGDKVAVHELGKQKGASYLTLFSDVRNSPEQFPAMPTNSGYFYCYPPVATERFFIYGQLGFTDWKTHVHVDSQITRGSCGPDTEGVIPANGLIYTFPKSCGCFSMLQGFGALAPAYKKPIPDSTELVKGPAYGTAISGQETPNDWPIYRGDAYRTGSNPVTVPAGAHPLWTTAIAAPAYKGPAADEWKEYPFSAGPLTPPVIAEGMVFLAQPHTDRVIALAASDGKLKWDFIAEGRVDTAPTISNGYCLFGCRSGWVYCLKAADGTLVWKLRVAPAELRIVQCGQVESPWPAQGSVLVSNGVAYFGAGIHPLADGGLRAFAVDIKTGTIKWIKKLTDMLYGEKGWHGRAGLEQDYFDLMVKDGDKIALSRWSFDPATGNDEFLWHNAYYRVGKDGAYMQRGTWSYGYPMNRPRMKRPLLVARGNTVLGATKAADSKQFAWPEGERNTATTPQRNGLRLFRRDFKPGEKFDVIWNEQENDTESRIGLYFPANRLAFGATWASEYPGWIEAMTWAGDNLFLYAKGKLKVYTAADGKLLGEKDLSDPVWDGIAAANGKMYVSTRDGNVICLGQ